MARVGERAHQRLTYRPELDGIRGIAILLVIAQHIQIPGLEGSGQTGVDLFFALSGYLITSLLLAERASAGTVSLRRFYERRVRRLAPALLAMIAVVAVVMALLGRLPEYPPQAMAALFYVANIAHASGFNMGVLDHTWTLSTEEQFYLVWPALFLLVPRRWLPSAVMLGLIGSLAMQQVFAGNVLAASRPDLRADAILWGCLLALRPVSLPRRFAVLAWLGVAISAVAGLPLALIGLASFVAMLGREAPFLRMPWLVRLGTISYGVYLWHYPIASLLWEPLGRGDLLAVTAVVFGSITLALASERFIERPWRRRSLQAEESERELHRVGPGPVDRGVGRHSLDEDLDVIASS